MEISTRGRYAIRILLDIAQQNGALCSISEIAKRQDISVKYSERIISMLSKAHLVTSLRGTNGGYKLTKSPSEYTLKSILDATDDSTKLATCNTTSCSRAKFCESKPIWDSLTELINDFLSNTTLQDVLDKKIKSKNS